MMKLISHVQPVICRSLNHDITELANGTQMLSLFYLASIMHTSYSEMFYCQARHIKPAL